MQLDSLFEQYITDKSRRCSLVRFTKKQDTISSVLRKSLHAVASGLCEGEKLTLLCRLVGQALDENLSHEAQVKMGGRFINFLHMHDLIELSKLNDSTWMVSCKDKDFQMLLASIAREKRVANITQRPSDWHKPFNRGVPIVKRLTSEDAHHYTIDKMPKVYKALNVLHNTEWMTNSRVLDLMVEGLDGFSPYVVEEDEAEAARKELCKLKRDSLNLEEWVFNQQVENNSNYARANAKSTSRNRFKMGSKDVRDIVKAFAEMTDFENAVKLAAEVEYEPLYFQHNCDSRGRLYTLSHRLSPQGSDTQKALLRFSTSGPISHHWIKVHIANSAGKDKLSYDGRVAWVNDNMEYITSVGKDPRAPLGYDWMIANKIHKEKKSKWQFIAACMEWVHYQETGEFRIPVGVDQTSSGLQFLSAIARDESIAEDVNISACTYAPVGDLYQRIGDAILTKANIEKVPSLGHLTEGSKSLRKLVKRSVMVFPYSCGGSSMGDHIFDDRGDYSDDKLDTMAFSESSYLGNLCYDTIRGELPRAAAVMDAMQSCFDGYTGSPTVSWTGPSGFRAYQYKPAVTTKRPKLVFDKRSDIKVVIYVENDSPNISDHKQAISPNVIHHLDSCMMVETICSMADAGVTQIHAVHDCVGTYSGEVDRLSHHVREAFYSIIKDDPVADIMDQALGNYEAPEKGNWNPRDVLTSPYFVC